MALFALADLHLAKDIDKPMDVFGPMWDRYMERIEANWKASVTDEDTVLIPGDISWATYLSEVDRDFAFIDSLPGKKIFSRGNHDYWWTTVRKMEKYLEEKGFGTISFLQNNAVEVESCLIGATRGWMLPNDAGFGEDDEKIYNRELARLSLCIKAMDQEDPEHKLKRIMMMHYPPLTKSMPKTDFTTALVEGGIDLCVYGHLHALGHKLIKEDADYKTVFKCVAADYVRFVPQRIV